MSLLKLYLGIREYLGFSMSVIQNNSREISWWTSQNTVERPFLKWERTTPKICSPHDNMTKSKLMVLTPSVLDLK